MWVAIYNDGTELAQYDISGNERLFREIELDRLDIFEVRLLGSDNVIEVYGVWLYGGIFRLQDSYFEFDGFEAQKLKLIYFRRVRQSLGGDATEEVWHCLGFEAAGKKRIMKISEQTHKVTFEIK